MKFYNRLCNRQTQTEAACRTCLVGAIETLKNMEDIIIANAISNVAYFGNSVVLSVI